MHFFSMVKRYGFAVMLFLCAGLSFSYADAACTNPAGEEGVVVYNQSWGVFQGCTATGWVAWNAPTTEPKPENCDTVGTVCTGPYAGIIYAGEYAGHKLYVTGADAPGTVETGGNGSGYYPWNNGEGNPHPDLSFLPNCLPLATPRVVNGMNRYSDQSNSACIGAQGPAFTKDLAEDDGSRSPYRAASYCYHLGKDSDPMGPDNLLAHGHDDWYLPAIDELEFIYDQLGPAPAHGFQLKTYFSSTERSGHQAWTHGFSNGYQGGGSNKDGSALVVRCVMRK